MEQMLKVTVVGKLCQLPNCGPPLHRDTAVLLEGNNNDNNNKNQQKKRDHNNDKRRGKKIREKGEAVKHQNVVQQPGESTKHADNQGWPNPRVNGSKQLRAGALSAQCRLDGALRHLRPRCTLKKGNGTEVNRANPNIRRPISSTAPESLWLAHTPHAHFLNRREGGWAPGSREEAKEAQAQLARSHATAGATAGEGEGQSSRRAQSHLASGKLVCLRASTARTFRPSRHSAPILPHKLLFPFHVPASTSAPSERKEREIEIVKPNVRNETRKLTEQTIRGGGHWAPWKNSCPYGGEGNGEGTP